MNESKLFGKARGRFAFLGILAIIMALAAALALAFTACPQDTDDQNLNPVVSVTITGTAQVGQTLTATAKDGSGTAVTATYQWQRADSSAGTFTDISGAAQATYQVQEADVEKYLRVTATNSATASPVASAATAQVTASGGGNPPPSTTAASAPKAEPHAASTTAAPKVLDSYTADGKNYYLIDVGYIENTYVSTFMLCHYNGVTPIALSKTTFNSTTLTEALTETVTESITVSDTQNVTVGVEVGWKKAFPIAGEFSAKLNAEWSGSWTNSSTTTRSKETSVSRAETEAEQFTVAFTVGEHGEQAGYYRYALYATSDVYFVVTTSADNQTLLGWETVVCARDSTYLPHFDYAADGKFDNAPVTGKIDFSDGFYKTLPVPPSPTYAVAFNANGGSGTVPSAQSVTAGNSITLPTGSGLSKTGYTLSGWSTQANGGTTYAVKTTYTPTANTTLYAQWTVHYETSMPSGWHNIQSDKTYGSNDNGYWGVVGTPGVWPILGGIANGSDLEMHKYENAGDYRWKFVSLGSGWYQIVPNTTVDYETICLDVTNSGTSDGTVLQVYKANGTAAQKFRFQKLGDNKYKIYTGVVDTKTIHAKSGNTSDGTALIIWGTDTGNTNQNELWHIFTR
jgi:uncharacterized repeat protein (TIGR02543 family)